MIAEERPSKCLDVPGFLRLRTVPQCFSKKDPCFLLDSRPVCSHALRNVYYDDRLCKTIPYIIHRQKEKNGELANRLEYLVTLLDGGVTCLPSVSTDLVEFR